MNQKQVGSFTQPMSLHKKFLVLIVTFSALLEIIDSTIVNVATPDIMGNLGTTLDQISWATNAYSISNLLTVIIAPWLANKLGRRNYIVGSMLIFTLCSYFCGQATNVWELVFFRFLQGAGGGAFLVTGQTIVIESFPKEKLQMANALFTMGLILGPALGPVLGGYLVESFSWPYIFYINIPLGIIATIGLYSLVEDSPYRNKNAKIDKVQYTFLALFVMSFITVLENGEREDWFAEPYIVVLTIIACITLLCYIFSSLKSKHPVINFHLFKDKNFAIFNIVNILSSIGMYSSTFSAPIFTQQILGYSPLQNALLILPATTLGLLLTPWVGKIPKKMSYLIAANLLSSVAIITFASLFFHSTPDISGHRITTMYIIRSLGFTLLFSPLSTLMFMNIKPENLSDASSTYSTIRKLSQTMGVAFTSTFIAQRLPVKEQQIGTMVQASSVGYQHRLHELIDKLQGMGHSLTEATSKAQQLLHSSYVEQFTFAGYRDAYAITLFSFLTCIIIVTLYTAYLLKEKGEKK
ncbi:DHA2 family efflux MFS transporter permease subunit [Halosquirtibacter laminarini]|uniref:DHA2 family efflux MFS transporter permease subunit n=1 Tax=Halosquirtibacter laminarini TaxID=3374600 RepID=A0AC61NE78_9BACT|nr:DHA2 family efflux MFS transporter permease subunit [Prolixibacteraceae bacterium]